MYQYISSEVRQDLSLQLYEPTWDMSIWHLHNLHTCAQGKNSAVVALNKAKPSQQFPEIYRFFIWRWFWFVVCSLNVVFKLNNVVFILKSHPRWVFSKLQLLRQRYSQQCKDRGTSVKASHPSDQVVCCFSIIQYRPP